MCDTGNLATVTNSFLSFRGVRLFDVLLCPAGAVLSTCSYSGHAPRAGLFNIFFKKNTERPGFFLNSNIVLETHLSGARKTEQRGF